MLKLCSETKDYDGTRAVCYRHEGHHGSHLGTVRDWTVRWSGAEDDS